MIFPLVVIYLSLTVFVTEAYLESYPVNPWFLNSRIINGVKTSIKSHPYNVAIEIDHKFELSGVIISPRHILTVGHALPKEKSYLKRITFRTGSSLTNTGGRVYNAEDCIRHEKFNIKWENQHLKPEFDIGLYIINGTFKFDETCQPIRVLSTTRPKAGTVANVTGWGSLYYEKNQNLRVAKVPIIDTKACNATHVDYKGIGPDQICTGGSEQPSMGDDGGPLVVGRQLVGLTSWRVGNNFPTVYSDIAYYRDWIKKYAGI